MYKWLYLCFIFRFSIDILWVNSFLFTFLSCVRLNTEAIHVEYRAHVTYWICIRLTLPKLFIPASIYFQVQVISWYGQFHYYNGVLHNRLSWLLSSGNNDTICSYIAVRICRGYCICFESIILEKLMKVDYHEIMLTLIIFIAETIIARLRVKFLL